MTDSPIEFLAKPVATAATHSYVRWYGRSRPMWYNYAYSEQELRPWLAELEGLEEKVPVVYAYFNNHYHGSAPANLLQLLEMRSEITDPQKKAKERAERRVRKAVKKLTDFIA